MILVFNKKKRFNIFELQIKLCLINLMKQSLLNNLQLKFFRIVLILFMYVFVNKLFFYVIKMKG